MSERGSGRTAGGTRIPAILVSAALHLAVAAFVIGDRVEVPPPPVLNTAAITLLPPVPEPEETVAAPPPPPETAKPERLVPAPTAKPVIAPPAPPEALPAALPVIQSITPPPRPEPSPPSDDDTVREDYARQLWQWIAARRPQGLRLDGEAVVAFSVARDGRLSDIALIRPSGSKPLDRLALRTVRLSAPVPTPPDALPEDALRFTLTFHFR